MAIAVEDVSTAAKTDTGADPLTYAHTVTAGDSRYLVVAVCSLNSDALAISSVTFNGVAMTMVNPQTSGSNNQRFRVYGLAAPDVGTFNIVVTQTVASRRIAAAARSLAGVDLTSQTRLSTFYAGIEDGGNHGVLSAAVFAGFSAVCLNTTIEFPDLILTFAKYVGTGPVSIDLPHVADFNTEFVTGEFFVGGHLAATADPTSWEFSAAVAGNWGLADVVFITALPSLSVGASRDTTLAVGAGVATAIAVAARPDNAIAVGANVEGT